MKQALVTIGQREFRVDVADSVFTRERGLSGRAALAPDAGMLFVFRLPWKYSFWMRGMQFPIDIVWIRKGRVVDITENAQPPQPGGSFLSLSRLKPRLAAGMALEINAGAAREAGIKDGDKVMIK